MKKIFPIFLLIALLLTSCGVLFDTVEPTAESTATTTTAEEVVPTQETVTATQEPLTNEENPCISFSILDNFLTTPYPNLPAPSEDDFSIGPDDAVLTFIVYTDPQCSYCGQFDPILDEFQAMYPDDVRVVSRFFPLSYHDKALLGIQALMAADLQGQFHTLKSFLFKRQYQDQEDEADLPASDFWVDLDPADFDSWLEEQVPALGIDADQLLIDMYDDEIVAKVATLYDEAIAIGIGGTPALYINGYEWPESSRGVDIFSVYLKLLKNKAIEMDECPPTVIDQDKSYQATIATTKGNIVVELYADKAPIAVNSFVYLAQEGWYNDLPILASSDFVLSGDHSDTSYGGPGYAYMEESNDLTLDEPGMLAVYSVWPGYGLNGSMFFINRVAMPNQENRTVFGKVIEGMDVLESISNRESNSLPVEDEVLEISIAEE